MKFKIINLVLHFFLYIIPLSLWSIPPQESVIDQLQQEITELVRKTKPSVVTISSKSSHSYIISKENGFLSLFKDTREEKTISYNSICSGLIYDENGYIITKNNDLTELDSISVILSDGAEYRPQFIGQDSETGITVLKIDAENISACTLTTSTNIELGSWITIIGNSMGVSPSISFGLVSGILEHGLIHFTAIVSPGNSGSPVFNSNGEVIGILAAQIEANEVHSNPNLFSEAGIAYPINKTCAIANKIIRSYKEQNGWIGIQIEADTTNPHFVRVVKVLRNSPAEKAGLKNGDIITKFNNNPLKSAQHLGKLIVNTKPGTTIPVNFLRSKTHLNVFLTVGDQKPLPKNNTLEYSNLKRSENLGITSPNSAPNNVKFLINKVNKLEQEIIELKSKIDQ